MTVANGSGVWRECRDYRSRGRPRRRRRAGTVIHLIDMNRPCICKRIAKLPIHNGNTTIFIHNIHAHRIGIVDGERRRDVVMRL